MKRAKKAQEMQDEIFRKMSADKKIKLASEISMFCLELNKLGKNEDNRPEKPFGKNSGHSRQTWN
jgi:hypothetical protein